jgi:RNA polymerase sigma-70 factor (ECF subfamily)
MTANETPDVANLLEHSAWLRRLAGHLVFEREDSVQDVWLAALRAPPDPDWPPRPWLTRVLKNAARRRHRDASVRRENEQRAAAMPTLGVTTPEELVARAETQLLLAELVLGLSEPLRRVILLRYYEGLSAAEIARALGMPPGTVRWQIKQGIDRLRSALDSRFGNDRHTWTPALALLAAGPRGHSSILGAAVMTAKMNTAAIILSLISLALIGIVWRSGLPAANGIREQAQLSSPTSSNSVAASHLGQITATAPSSAASTTMPPTGGGLIPGPSPVAHTLLEPPARQLEGASAPTTRFWNLPEVIDRRPDRHEPDARSEHVREALGYAFQTLDEDAAGCLTAQTGSGGSGEVMVAFGISKDGLRKVWIVDGGTEVPIGQQSCLTNAVHGHDWSNIVDEPIEVTKKFDLARLTGQQP